MTTNFAHRIIVLVTIAFFAFILSGCSGGLVNAVSNIGYDGSKPASVQMVQSSPRIADCNTSNHQLILNNLNGDLKAASEQAGNEVAELDVTTDEWLSGQMQTFECIAQ
jgi:hypothetical protein